MIQKKQIIGAAAAVYCLTALATASGAAVIIAEVICGLVPDVTRLAWALALLVFVYGGAKYAYSADDPGGRKQGKNIAINAMIGLIIVGAARAVIVAIAGNNNFCP
jgi:hypothetical protein